MMDHPHNRQLQMEVMEYVRCELRPEEGWANVSHIRCSRSSRSQSLVFGVENDFYQVLNKTIIFNWAGVEYDSFVNYSDHDHAQAVSKAFHRAARDLPFMPLKFPAEGDFNNEEVDVLSLRQLSWISRQLLRLETLEQCCTRLLAYSRNSLTWSPLPLLRSVFCLDVSYALDTL